MSKKNTVDYFPHYVSPKDISSILEKKFGLEGYCFWFKLQEVLGGTENHFLEFNKSKTLLILTERTTLDELKMEKILNLLSELEAIDPRLWQEKIIWSQVFIDDIDTVYKARKKDTPSKPNLNDLRILQEIPENSGKTETIPKYRGPSQEFPALVEKVEDKDKEKEYVKEINREKENNIYDELPKTVLQNLIQDNYPRISKLKQQLSQKESENLTSEFSMDLLIEKLDAMENKVDLLKKYVSVAKTLRNWCKKKLINNSAIEPFQEKKNNQFIKEPTYKELKEQDEESARQRGIIPS